MDPLANKETYTYLTVDEINHLDEVTLRETIGLMNSDNYKERFIAEYLQLVIRYTNLRKMLIKHEAGTLNFEPKCDISILDDQLYHMEGYLRALEVRAEVEKIELPRI